MMNREQFIEFHSELLKESDRGLAIMSGELLSEALRKLHETQIETLTNSKKLVTELLDSMQPISSFSARAKIAYAYNLIPSSIYDDLQVIRTIRNRAAHFDSKPGANPAQRFAFELPTIKRQVLKLKLGYNFLTKYNADPMVLELLNQGQYDPENSPKTHFHFSCQFAHIEILDHTNEIMRKEAARLARLLKSKFQRA